MRIWKTLTQLVDRRFSKIHSSGSPEEQLELLNKLFFMFYQRASFFWKTELTRPQTPSMDDFNMVTFRRERDQKTRKTYLGPSKASLIEFLAKLINNYSNKVPSKMRAVNIPLGTKCVYSNLKNASISTNKQ